MKDIPMSELREQWSDEMAPDVYRTIMRMYERSLEHRKGEQTDRLERLASTTVGISGKLPGSQEVRALEFALLHCFERQSVVPEHELLETAIRFGMGSIEYQRLLTLVRSRSDVLRREHQGRLFLTTPEIVAEEAAMIEWVRYGKGTHRQLGPNHVIRDTRLNDDQRAAVHHILKSTDTVVGINGKAGAGKTTAMKETISAMESNGHRPRSCKQPAPAAAARWATVVRTRG